MANSTCFSPMKATSNGSFQGENPLNFALPLAILQICLIVVLTRTIAFVLRPLRQPRVIAEIIGGILLGPSAIGRSKAFLNTIFPKQSMTVLDTLANIGLLFFLFLVGLELDLNSLRRTGKRALSIALVGISIPFLLGIGTSIVLRNFVVDTNVRHAPFLVFMGVALSITAFPVLARILAELKLLTTDLGRIAMSAAAVNDVAAWILLALAIALSGSGSPIVSLWVLLSGIAFVLFAAFVMRPVFAWLGRHCLEGEPVKEVYICGTLTAVLAAGFVTDAIGIHALFGAFVVGIFVPKEGPFAGVIIEKVEDLISGLFLPLYFVSSGLKTNIATMGNATSWGLLVLVIFTACLGKIGGTFLASIVMKVGFREAITLGFLMNTKGLVELIVLNIGKDRKVLNDETFAIMVLMALFTTFITTPIVTTIYKPSLHSAPYKHRKIDRSDDSTTELRILACFYSTRTIPTLINLIESSRGTAPRLPLTVYALHLIELSERPSAIHMLHKARRNGLPFYNKNNHNSTHQIIVPFQTYQQLSQVIIRPMIAISDLHTIHIDIVTSAHQKRASLILLPFHKTQLFDNSMESTGNRFQQVNKRVLQHSPCTVAILIDRGLGGSAQVSASQVSYSVTALFFGGSDDREALAYGLRMAQHPGIFLTVIRFVFSSSFVSSDKGKIGVILDDNQRSNDDLCIGRIKDESGSVKVDVRGVSNREEIVGIIKELERCNLFLVGQRAPVEPLVDRVECPELGPVGSYMGGSNSTSASVLVIRQYDPSLVANPLVEEVAEDAVSPPDTPRVIGGSSEA